MDFPLTAPPEMVNVKEDDAVVDCVVGTRIELSSTGKKRYEVMKQSSGFLCLVTIICF